jgi:hypothetical protein
MLVIIDSELSDPPSSRTCFRDATLYASVFKKLDVLVECTPKRLDFYWRWLKQGGALDFIDQFILFGEVSGTSIRKDIGGTLNIARLDEVTLSRVTCFLNNIINEEEYRRPWFDIPTKDDIS